MGSGQNSGCNTCHIHYAQSFNYSMELQDWFGCLVNQCWWQFCSNLWPYTENDFYCCKWTSSCPLVFVYISTTPYIFKFRVEGVLQTQRQHISTVSAISHNMPFSAQYRTIFCILHVIAQFIVLRTFSHNLPFSTKLCIILCINDHRIASINIIVNLTWGEF